MSTLLKIHRINAAIILQKLYRGHRGRVLARVFKIKANRRNKAMQACLRIIPLIGKSTDIATMVGDLDNYGLCVRCYDCSKFNSRGNSGSMLHICVCGHYVRNHVKDYYQPPHTKEPELIEKVFYMNAGYISADDLHKVFPLTLVFQQKLRPFHLHDIIFTHSLCESIKSQKINLRSTRIKQYSMNS